MNIPNEGFFKKCFMTLESDEGKAFSVPSIIMAVKFPLIRNILTLFPYSGYKFDTPLPLFNYGEGGHVWDQVTFIFS